MKGILFAIMVGLSTQCYVKEKMYQDKCDMFSDAMHSFIEYLRFHGKSYADTEQFLKRYGLFKQTHQFIADHNTNGNSNYQLGHNFLSDLTALERKAYTNQQGFNITQKSQVQSDQSDDDILFDDTTFNDTLLSNDTLPMFWDWRDRNGVTKVKDQGQVGTCYSFSSTGAIETQYAKQTNTLVEFSEQQIVDCSDSNNNINGGMMDLVFEDLKSKFRLTTEDKYPYIEGYNGKCLSTKGIVSVTDIIDVQPNNMNAFKQALMQGTLSVAIQANQQIFQFYKSGVLTSNDCFTGQLDHAVLVVGYGITDDKEQQGIEYVVIKNSWSSQWAEQGYIRLAFKDQSGSGVCGFMSQPSYPIIAIRNESQQNIDIVEEPLNITGFLQIDNFLPIQ